MSTSDVLGRTNGAITMVFARLFASLLLTFAFLGSVPARADWYEASSDHFVIYADDSEKDIRRYAQNLERFHAAMELLTRRKVEKPSPSNRVVIFAVGSQRDVRKLSGRKSRYVAGFYRPRAGASRAFVQDIRHKSGYPDFSTIVLLHEYAHHFLISQSRFGMPRWLNEGAAEFFASASFPSKGGIQIGLPAQHRANELFNSADVSIYELLDHELYERNRGKGYDAFYGRSWLLYHYLTFNEDRQGQLSKYQAEVLSGLSSHEAGKKAFGDLDQHEKELRSYLRKRMPGLGLAPERLPIGEVTLRKLPKGEAEMMPIRIRSQRGVDKETAAEVLADARKVAAKYPSDAGVLSALAEAEYDAGNDAEAIAAADAAIAIDPARTNPYVQKG